jgi:undecaprenyl-diphosphatase
MLFEIILAIVQAATEFLPVSSSGHLAIISTLFSKPNLFFFTALHIASLVAVLIFTRSEIKFLFTFSKEAKQMWKFLIIATIPAALVGFLFHNFIESTFSSFAFLACAFLFTSVILLLTKYHQSKSEINSKNSLLIGLFQTIALFPGVSRSSMTISSGLFAGIPREQAAKFSFLLFIPLAIGAFVLELGDFYFNVSLAVSFMVCLVLSIVFLNVLVRIIKHGYFWMFSFYTLALAILCLVLSVLGY